MRIAHITQSYPPMISGAAGSVRQLALAGAAAGHEVLVLTASDRPRPYSAANSRLRVMRLRSHHNPLRVGQRFLLWPGRSLAAHLQAFAPDVIHLHEPLTAGLCTLRANRRLGTPIVLSMHQLPMFVAAYLPATLGLQSAVEGMLWRYGVWFLGRCGAAVAPTQMVADVVRRRAGISAEVIGYGVDPRRFCPLPAGSAAAEAADLRRKYGLDPNRPVLLHVGRLDIEKRVDHLLHAAAQTLAATEAQLVIVGDGQQRARLTELSQALGLAGRCHFTGYVAADGDLPGLYRLADVFVTASAIETFGIVVLEAMASARPVAAVQATCLPELIDAGRGGFLAPPDDAAALANRLTWLLGHPAEARAMGDYNRQRALQYTEDRFAERHLELYAALVRAPVTVTAGKKLLPAGNF